MAKAYVLMHCELGSEKDVIALLNKIDGIKEAHGTLGLYGIIVYKAQKGKGGDGGGNGGGEKPCKGNSKKPSCINQ